MGKPGKPLTWIEKYGHYAVAAGAALDIIAIKYLGFPVVIPAAVYVGFSYAVYKGAVFVAQELRSAREDEQRRILRRLPNPEGLEQRLEQQK